MKTTVVFSVSKDKFEELTVGDVGRIIVVNSEDTTAGLVFYVNTDTEEEEE